MPVNPEVLRAALGMPMARPPQEPMSVSPEAPALPSELAGLNLATSKMERPIAQPVAPVQTRTPAQTPGVVNIPGGGSIDLRGIPPEQMKAVVSNALNIAKERRQIANNMRSNLADQFKAQLDYIKHMQEQQDRLREQNQVTYGNQYREGNSYYRDVMQGGNIVGRQKLYDVPEEAPKGDVYWNEDRTQSIFVNQGETPPTGFYKNPELAITRKGDVKSEQLKDELTLMGLAQMIETGKDANDNPVDIDKAVELYNRTSETDSYVKRTRVKKRLFGGDKFEEVYERVPKTTNEAPQDVSPPSPPSSNVGPNKGYATKPAPPEAVEYLRQNPELADQFKAKYGYLPEGFNE